MEMASLPRADSWSVDVGEFPDSPPQFVFEGGADDLESIDITTLFPDVEWKYLWEEPAPPAPAPHEVERPMDLSPNALDNPSMKTMLEQMEAFRQSQAALQAKNEELQKQLVPYVKSVKHRLPHPST